MRSVKTPPPFLPRLKPTDYEELGYSYPTRERMANIANEVIEKIEANCIRVTGYSAGAKYWNGDQAESDTHEAFLIGVRKIKQGVTKAEILQAVTSCKDAFENYNLPKQFSKMHDLLTRIEREGIVDDTP